jgi:hypothetical protein
MKNAVSVILFLSLIMYGCSSWSFLPENRQVATQADINEKTLSLYAHISAQNQLMNALFASLDSLTGNLDSTTRVLKEKDIEIDQLKAEIRTLNRENNDRFRYLQDIIIYQNITIDSLFAHILEQQEFQLFLTDIRDLPDSEQSSVLVQKQMGLLKENMDSLNQKVRTVVQHQHFLREDLSIVESSIMDIIKFSSDKHVREIERRHQKVMDKQEILSGRQDSIIAAYDSLMLQIKDVADQFDSKNELIMDSLNVTITGLTDRLNTIQVQMLELIQTQAELYSQMRFLQEDLTSQIRSNEIMSDTTADSLDTQKESGQDED